MSIGVAIIGGGIFAREEHLPAVQASQHLDLKAIWSRSLKSAESLAAGTAVDLYSDDADSGKGKGYDAVLSRADVHAVIIALPILAQPEYIKKALLAGKHVFSEKPIAKDVATAQDLIKWYAENIKGVTWTIAENFRYLESFKRAAAERKALGKIVEFTMRRHTCVKGGKYFETPWRKTPEYQGGFLLDGGVHDVAGLRMLIGDDPVTRLAAFTRLNQPHLPPVDTIDATMKLKSSATGTVSQSFGTTFPTRSEWAFACENGSMTIAKTAEIVNSQEGPANVVSVFNLKGELVKQDKVADERTGVPPEVRYWGEALAAGRVNADQRPEEALADLELIEKMLRSGENDGETQTCSLQAV